MDYTKNKIFKFFRVLGLETLNEENDLLEKVRKNVSEKILNVHTELCYYVEVTEELTPHELKVIQWLLRLPYQLDSISTNSHLNELLSKNGDKQNILIEIGPRFNFSTPLSSNIVAICKSLDLNKVCRVEKSKRYLFTIGTNRRGSIVDTLEKRLVDLLHDRMTECQYTTDNIPKYSFNEKLVKKDDLKDVDLLKNGRKALEQINIEMGFAFDSADLDYYTDLFVNVLKRNPTSVELFDLAQSNSEHSRHWFFKGKIIIDNEAQEKSLIDWICETQNHTHQNNVIKFSDNSSAIRGFETDSIRPKLPERSSKFVKDLKDVHLIFTAETHNFPTGVAPFSGATTGTGGRIRDVQAVGRGGYCVAGTAGYSTGNLLIPDYDLSWEDETFEYPNNFASPLEILIEASNGASDYGNKFGEPLILGFTRTFGLVDQNGERKEYIKPIMFSGGVGYMDADMTNKLTPEEGMLIVKLGGPVYRIGVGGGAASSIEIQGDNQADLDFNAVQRGDPEMEQKLNRVIRACLEQHENNPIISIHDQGAGGNGNVLKELVEPVGGVIYANKFELGDPTINILELWGAEYQENNALLCRPGKDEKMLRKISGREKCPINFVGKVENSGKMVLYLDEKDVNSNTKTPYNLKLEHVLGKMPQKTFHTKRLAQINKPLTLNPNMTIMTALNKVLSLPTVCSKRFLTNKVDRCVTGLIAQQQCVGPLHTPLSDYAITTVSYFDHKGVATSIGEQPIKGLLNNAVGARMTVAEAITNLAFVKISHIKDIKCSGNWMWPAKLEGEGAAIYDTCVAMCKVMNKLGIAIDGGKDSLSMAARVGQKTVKSPGTLVVSCYAPCPDVRQRVTPDFKGPSRNCSTCILHVDVSNGKTRVGGTALAQCHKQLGEMSPDLDEPQSLVNAFNVVQSLISEDKILAGHDISDGGFLVCVLEMAFAGICGFNLDLFSTDSTTSEMNILFTEELGFILEVYEYDLDYCLQKFRNFGISCKKIGYTGSYGITSDVNVKLNKKNIFKNDLLSLYKQWERTSYELEKLQMSTKCAQQEFEVLEKRRGPKYRLTFNPDNYERFLTTQIIRVAILREEGTNSDRELAAILLKVGFDVWDVTMTDLITGDKQLNEFRGVFFPGGFSYADVLGSAKGWAASIAFNEKIKEQFNQFYQRQDTFSFGICNGCQLMCLIGWVADDGGINHVINDMSQFTPDVYLDHNDSARFECRWSTVKIESSSSIMLEGMENTVFGIWTAHGEGKFRFKNEKIQKKFLTENLAPLKYVDDFGEPTEIYPMNPNGSPEGIAAVCSTNGRHLAMMPHPERCAFKYQCPYIPYEFEKFEHSPWERMFQNAYNWCCK